jgi:hypothetical protein
MLPGPHLVQQGNDTRHFAGSSSTGDLFYQMIRDLLGEL